MLRLRAVAVLAMASLVVLAGATARPAGAGGTTSQTFSYTGGLQTFTVPDGVATVTIQAVGAAGGSGQMFPGGQGASMQGDFSVSPGDVLTILAGESPYAGVASGGGGGTFVWQGTGAASVDNLLIAAGGGGGAACVLNGVDASIGEDGVASLGGIPGGTAGNGGSGGHSGGSDFYAGVPGGGGGGGGLLTSGGAGDNGNDGPFSWGVGTGAGGLGGNSIASGGARATLYDVGQANGGDGGYGGGGMAATGPGGGGGGYSGGGGGTGGAYLGTDMGAGTNACDSGGGGGSYNAGANQVNQAGVGFYHGYVVISYGAAAPSDTMPPTITASATSGPDPYTGGTWTRQPVQVHFDCTDADSGVASVTPDQYLNTDQNDQSVTGTCTDNAGNQATATFDHIDVDMTPPAASITALDAFANPYTVGTWSSVPITVHVLCTDDLSGVANAFGDTTVSNVLDFSDTGECVDNAGNTSVTPTLSHIDVDTTAPAVTATATSNGSPYTGQSWTNHNVVVHFSCVDGLSGVSTVSADQTVSTEGLDQSASGSCTDVAGNVGYGSFDHIWIDKTPPSVTYTGNAGTYALSDQVSIQCHANDGLSGLQSSTCSDVSGPAWTFGTGETVSATAHDYAGNDGYGSATFTVGVTFAGLEGLVSHFCTNAGVASGLNAKLDAASAAKARGQTKTEQNQLNAFGNQVNAQTGKCLTAAQAALLVQFASAL